MYFSIALFYISIQYDLILILFFIFFFLVKEDNFNNQLNALAVINPVECPNECGRSYKGLRKKRPLKRHLLYECGKPPQFQCMVCSKRFTNKNSMQYDLAAIHTIINH